MHKELYLYVFHSKKNAGSNVLNFIFGQAIECELKNLYILIVCFMLGFNFQLRNFGMNGN